MVDVLYVAGEGRSGSTVLGNVLGESDRFFHAGEVRYLWQMGVEEDRLCGCGKPFSACGFWQGVMARAFAGDPADVALMRRADKVLSGFRRRPAEELFSAPELRTAEFDAYVGQLGRLYGALGEACPGRTVVDSSKSPYYLYALSRAEGVRLRVLHLVRDPRAVAFSLRRKRARPDAGADTQMARFRADRSARRWNRLNRATDVVAGRVAEAGIAVRYEDFAASPEGALRRIHALVGGELPPGLLQGGRTVRLGENHGVWGNPSRFKRGPTELRADDEWQRRMPLFDRLLVTVMTAATRKRFGY